MEKEITPIVTINFNGKNNTIDLLESLLKSGESFSLIIVDNHSDKKGELQFIRDYLGQNNKCLFEDSGYRADDIENCFRARITPFQQVVLIESKENGGFSKGTNIGLRCGLALYPDSDFYGIMNNDTIATANFLTNIEKQIKLHNLGAAMGTILYYGYNPSIIWSIGGHINWVKGEGIHEEKDTFFKSEKYPFDYYRRSFISGCFTVFRKEALLENNLLDEDYFFGGEEFQYSLDLRKKGRYEIGWVPSSVIFHKSKLGIGNGSSHNINDIVWQYNAYIFRLIFVNKNYSIVLKKIWHLLFRIYLSIIIKRKYRRIYPNKSGIFQTLRKNLLENIDITDFSSSQFSAFSSSIVRK